MQHEKLAVESKIMNSFDMNGFGPFATNERGIDMTIVWMYRHILRDGGSVKVTPDQDDTNKFDVAFCNSNGQVMAAASLPGVGTCLSVSHIRSHWEQLKERTSYQNQ